MNKIKRKGVFSVIGAFLFNLILGSYHIWPNLLKYYNLYIQDKNKNIKLNSKIEILIIPIFRLFYSIFIPIGIIISRKINIKKITIFSYILILISHIIILYTSSYLNIIISLILFGISIGISSINLTVNAWLFFPIYRGLIFGFVSTGNALGNYLFQKLGEKLINPYNINIEKNSEQNKFIIDNFSFFLKIIICIYFLIGIISIILLSPWKKSMINGNNILKKNDKYIPLSDFELMDERTNNNFDVVSINRNKSLPYNGYNKNEKIYDPLHSKPFLQLIFMFNLSTLFSSLKMYDFPDLKNKDFKNYISFIYTITDILFRFLWGGLLDIYDFKSLYLFSLYIQIGIFSTYYFIVDIKYFCVFYNFLEGVTFSCNFVMEIFSYYKIFGVNNGGILFGINKIFSSFTQFIIVFLINYLNKDSIYFLILCLFYSLTSMLSSIILCFIEVKKFDYDRYTNEKIKKRRFSTSTDFSNEDNI